MPAFYFFLSQLFVAGALVSADSLKDNTASTEIERNRDMLRKEGVGDNKLLGEILDRLDRQESRIQALEATVRRQQQQSVELTNIVNKQTMLLEDQDRTILQLKVLQRRQMKHIDDLEYKLIHRVSVTANDTHTVIEAKHRSEIAEETQHADGRLETDTEARIAKKGNRGLTKVPRQSLDIAFHAAINVHTVLNLGSWQKITFDTAMLNIGSAYHEQLGAFIAPTRGVYFFSASLLSLRNDKTRFMASIMKDGVREASLYGNGADGDHDQMSTSVTIQLEQGDEVWVQSDRPSAMVISGNNCSTFTGYLVFAN